VAGNARYLAVGSPSLSPSGRVDVYIVRPDGITHVATIAPVFASNAFFGCSVALDATNLLTVGANGFDNEAGLIAAYAVGRVVQFSSFDIFFC